MVDKAKLEEEVEELKEKVQRLEDRNGELQSAFNALSGYP